MTPLWPHQLAACNHIEPHGSGFLFLDMGAGKTLSAIELMRRWRCRRILVLAPKSVVSVWPREWRKHTGDNQFVVPFDNGTTADRARRLRMLHAYATATGEPFVAVTNYDAAICGEMPDTLLGLKWDALVLDESHRLKGVSGKQSALAARLGQAIPHRLGLTGTPMPHSPLDAFAQYRAVAPEVFGASYIDFEQRYADMREFQAKPGKGGYRRKFRKAIGYRNQDELHRRMYSVAYRVRTEDVLTLPEAVDVQRYCLLEPTANRVYKQLEADLKAQVAEGTVTAENALTRILRLAQVANGYCKTDDGETRPVGTEKRELLAEILDEIGIGEPVVVFGRFHEDLQAIIDVAREAGRDPREHSGRRKDLADPSLWQDGEGDTLAVQLQAGGVGVDFTRARYAVYYAVDHNWGNYEQTRRRVHRPGQRRDVVYIHLIAAGTVDEDIYGALERREDVCRAVVDRFRGGPSCA